MKFIKKLSNPWSGSAGLQFDYSLALQVNNKIKCMHLYVSTADVINTKQQKQTINNQVTKGPFQ